MEIVVQNMYANVLKLLLIPLGFLLKGRSFLHLLVLSRLLAHLFKLLILLWLLWALAAAACVNFLVRIGLVYQHFRAGDPTKS